MLQDKMIAHHHDPQEKKTLSPYVECSIVTAYYWNRKNTFSVSYAYAYQDRTRKLRWQKNV